MVSITKQAFVDLDFILIGMLEWNKIELSFELVDRYIDDILDECYKLDKLLYHFDTVYDTHIPFGSKIHRYKRSSKTVWYLIYDIENNGDIFVNKIISNYVTNE